MYLLDVSIRYLKYFCVLFVLFVFLFMLLASLRCYTFIFDGFIGLLVSLIFWSIGLLVNLFSWISGIPGFLVYWFSAFSC